MTDPFMRVDLSQASRDFQPIALEPGLPLLDRSNSNGQTLRKWLGGYVAEAERIGDRVAFFVRDDEGRRIDSVYCSPLTDKDLSGELAKDVRELQKRIEAVKAQSPNEQLIHRVVIELIRNLSDESKARDRRCSLLKYRDGQNKTHLVWCPGYRQRDTEPATPLVCTNPKCLHLFLQRPNAGTKCTVCQVIRKERTDDKPRRTLAGSLTKLLAVALLISLSIGFIWWNKQGNETGSLEAKKIPLTVEPSNWTGPVGSQVEFVITRNDGAQPELVSESATALVADPKILSLKPNQNVGKALSPGTTEITFYVGSLTTTATITVDQTMPTKLLLRPEKLELGIGTTARIKLIGEFPDGNQADLTDVAEWEPCEDGKFFIHKGHVEGEEAGTGVLRVRYPSGELEDAMIATAEVAVRDYQYKGIKLSLEPERLTVGMPAKVRVVATTDSGSELAVDESKDLTIKVSPADQATISGSELLTSSEGAVTLTAQFRGHSATLDVMIGKSTGDRRGLAVSPQKLDLKIGEISPLSVVSSSPTKLQFKSSDLEIVEVADDGRLIGRSAGTTEIEVNDGGTPVKVTANVSGAQFVGIELEPQRVSLRTDESAVIRIFGLLEEGNRVELTPDLVTWATLPRAEFVEFTRSLSRVKGLKPTRGESELLSARLGKNEATAKIAVISAPLVLTLSPSGSLDIPVGQKQRLTIQSRYGGAAAEDVPADRVEWIMSDPGFRIQNGEIHAENANSELRLKAKYQQAISNEVLVKSVSAAPLKLNVSASPTTVATGQSGIVAVTAAGPAGEVTLNEEGLRFVSEQPDVLQISETTGAFRALQPGTATIRVEHPASKKPGTADVTVVLPTDLPINGGRLERVASLRIVAPQGSKITLPIDAEFSDWKVEAVGENGSVTDVSRQSTLIVDGDSTKAALSGLLKLAGAQLNLETEHSKTVAVIRDDRIVGVNSGSATVHAIFGGQRTTNGLSVEVTKTVDADEVRLMPAETNLVIDESARLNAFGYKNGFRIGEITNCSELKWTAKDEDVVFVEGPQLTALHQGKTSVTAQVGALSSKPANVSVTALTTRGETPIELGKLTVSAGSGDPRTTRLRMKTGEIVQLGREVVVRRQGTDFSNQCEVASSDRRVVFYQEDSRSLLAVSPGTARVTLILRDQSTVLDIDVEPASTSMSTATFAASNVASNASIVVEPSTGKLAVGERLPVRVFIINADGTRSSTTVNLTSRNGDIATTVGGEIQGISPGEVTIEAKVPGIEQPGKAVFQVEESAAEKLVFVPARMTVAVGQRKPFEVYFVTPQGRKKLGDDPQLKLTLSDGDKETIELDASNRDVVGKQTGNAIVVATWKNGLTQKLPVAVEPNEIQELLIHPEDATVSEGKTIDFQVLARQNGQLRPLTAADGVELQVANPVVADVRGSEFGVDGLKVGKTEITAKLGTKRAVAQLTVVPNTKVVLPASSSTLRFVPETLKMDLSSKGESVRVVRVLADKTEEDVTKRAKITVIEPKDIVDVEQRDSEAIVRPKKIGQTLLDASLDGVACEKPMLVDVGPNPKPPTVPDATTRKQQPYSEPNGDAHKPAVPDSTGGKNSGGQGGGGKGQGGGGKGSGQGKKSEPKSPDKSAASNQSTGKGGSNRGGPGSSTSTPIPIRLRLDGPSETTVGAEVQLRVELVVGSDATDVTNQSQLVLVPKDDAPVEVRPGGIIRATAPGKVAVQARFGDRTSAPHEITISPVSTDFQKLELEMTRERMNVGESRNYKLWGYPRGGGTRHDLTNLIGEGESKKGAPQIKLQVLKPDSKTEVVSHRPGTVVGREPGQFSLQGKLGDRLFSNVVSIDVTGTVDTPDRMRVDPDRFSILEGETTPRLRIQVALAGERSFRTIEPSMAEVTCSNPEILLPIEGGQFVAQRPGQAKLNVSFHGLEQSIPVIVKYNPFKDVAVSNPKPVDSALTVDLTVTANPTNDEFEYRCLLPNSRGRPEAEGPWIPAKRDEKRLTVQLQSPKIPSVKGQNHYAVTIEARRKKTDEVERYPFDFKLATSGTVKPANAK